MTIIKEYELPKYVMRYIEYKLDKTDTGDIEFDQELTSEKMGWSNGDKLLVSIEDGSIVLKKL